MGRLEIAKHAAAAFIPLAKFARVAWAEAQGYFRLRAEGQEHAARANKFDGVIGTFVEAVVAGAAFFIGQPEAALIFGLLAAENTAETVTSVTVAVSMARHNRQIIRQHNL